MTETNRENLKKRLDRIMKKQEIKENITANVIPDAIKCEYCDFIFISNGLDWTYGNLKCRNCKKVIKTNTDV